MEERRAGEANPSAPAAVRFLSEGQIVFLADAAIGAGGVFRVGVLHAHPAAQPSRAPAPVPVYIRQAQTLRRRTI